MDSERPIYHFVLLCTNVMKISIFDLPLILTREGLLSFLFGLIFIKKIIKLDLKKKKPKPVQTDLFRFGSVILEQKPVQISFFGLARFFSVWVRFFRFQAYKTETKPVNFLNIIISFFFTVWFFQLFFF